MKVGIYLNHLDPKAGGAFTYSETLVYSLAKALCESRHEFVLLFRGKEDPTKIYKFDIRAFQLVRLPNETLYSRIARIIMSLVTGKIRPGVASGLRSNQIDKLSRKIEIDFLILISSANRPSDIPYLVLVWDLQHRLQPWFPEVSSGGTWDVREDGQPTLLRRASFLVTGTEAGKSEIEMFYNVPSDRIRVLRMPTSTFAEIKTTHSDVTWPNGFKMPEHFLFYPANFWSHKNHVGLLYANKYLREKYRIYFDLVFVGAEMGNLEHVKQVSSELGLEYQTHFLGFISREQLVLLYARAFALAFVSFFGPDNLPPLEAFALGCPVIAAEVPGTREQLGDAAFLVNPKSPEQIAGAIKMLHDDPQLRETLIIKGKQRSRRFTGDDFVRGLFGILDEFEPIRRCWRSD